MIRTTTFQEKTKTITFQNLKAYVSHFKISPVQAVLIVVSVLTLGGLAASSGIINQGTSDDTLGGLLVNNDHGFQNVLKENADDVNNLVTNMLNGREDPGYVLKYITAEYKNSLNDATYSQEQINYNTKYQAFLNAAYEVAKVKLYTPEDQEAIKAKVAVMNAAKAQLN